MFFYVSLHSKAQHEAKEKHARAQMKEGKFLLIYICNFHVLSNLLLIYICKLHWNIKVVSDDLDLSRIWSGFGSKIHKTFYGSQLIIGRGSDENTTGSTTGTGWHCAAGNNWFVQVRVRFFNTRS